MNFQSGPLIGLSLSDVISTQVSVGIHFLKIYFVFLSNYSYFVVGGHMCPNTCVEGDTCAIRLVWRSDNF